MSTMSIKDLEIDIYNVCNIEVWWLYYIYNVYFFSFW